MNSEITTYEQACEDAAIVYQPRTIVISKNFTRNISRVHRWLRLTSDFGGGFTSKYHRYRGYKLIENNRFSFVFFKYPQK